MLWLPFFARAKAIADAALPATSYTAADVLAKIETVDGSGSGLDADLLDGTDWRAPGAIGGVTPGSGAFTTLSASGLITATGGQIKFPSVQVPSADANTLDDYVESPYTPTVTAGSGTFTTVAATGKYRKIGDTWFVRVKITITSNGSAATSVKFTLPATASDDAYLGGANITNNKAMNGNVASGSNIVTMFLYDGTYPGTNPGVLLIEGFFT